MIFQSLLIQIWAQAWLALSSASFQTEFHSFCNSHHSSPAWRTLSMQQPTKQWRKSMTHKGRTTTMIQKATMKRRKWSSLPQTCKNKHARTFWQPFHPSKSTPSHMISAMLSLSLPVNASSLLAGMADKSSVPEPLTEPKPKREQRNSRLECSQG